MESQLRQIIKVSVVHFQLMTWVKVSGLLLHLGF